VTAFVVLTDYILMGMMGEEDIGVEEAFFSLGADLSYGPCAGEGYGRRPRLPLGEVSAVAYSETVRDLQSLAPAGRK
jgi:hypothetical protein